MAAASPGRRFNGQSGSAVPVASASKTDRVAPLTERRLLDVPGMAGYLSLGDDTIRELETGLLASARVHVPGPGGGKVLFDRHVVDQIVAGCAACGHRPPAIHSRTRGGA